MTKCNFTVIYKWASLTFINIATKFLLYLILVKLKNVVYPLKLVFNFLIQKQTFPFFQNK